MTLGSFLSCLKAEASQFAVLVQDGSPSKEKQCNHWEIDMVCTLPIFLV